MKTIPELLARAAALRDETALNSISPERAGGIMYDTLLALNDLWLQQGAALVISKIYASVAAMEADTAPVSDLTGKPLRPGQIVVIASSDSDNGSVYRYNGTESPSWSLVGSIGNLDPVDSLDSDSTILPLAAHQGKVLDGKISLLDKEVEENTENIVNLQQEVDSIQPIVIEGNVTNAPDEEDITTDSNNLLKFADRPTAVNQMGYVILRKNKTFASQVTDTNTIYEIRYNFDLNGGTVTIPSGCTLRFNGGAVSNGSIVYNNTEIQGEPIINCTCTGGLRNSVVTPQMYGAKADGVTDDQIALNNAAKYNDCLFIPAGVYIITEPITMHSGMTLFGVGRESKLINPTISGYNKVCVFSGGMQVGTNTGSFLNLPAYACTISADRMSIETADTSPFQVGDLVFICKDETYTSKNPPHYWNGKIVEITENQSLKLDFYIDNDDLVGVDCLVRDLAVLPQGGGHYADFITENICIHDLSLINSEDQGSGMYVMSIGSYGAEIYNVWSHGNTTIGSNYLVNATIRDVVAEFDGGFLDIPEINQNVEVSECRAKRFGSRQNTIGLTFLQGYKAFVHDNFFDFGNLGKLGFGNHIKPIIKNNVLLNLYVSSGRPIELSVFGNSIFTGNRVSTSVSTSIINLTGLSNGNIVADNYIENPNTLRWIENYSTVNFGENVFRDNYLTRQSSSDAYFYRLPYTKIGTFLDSCEAIGTRAINVGQTINAFNSPKTIYNAKCVRITIMLSRGNYKVKLTTSAASGNTTTLSLNNASWIEIFFFASSNYYNFRKDGDDAGSYRGTLNNHGALAGIDITNSDAENAGALYVCLVECVTP